MAEVHPFSKARYERLDDGTVKVSHEGKEGVFRWDGVWLSGALRHADCHLCLWVAGAYGGRAGVGRYRGSMLRPDAESLKKILSEEH